MRTVKFCYSVNFPSCFTVTRCMPLVLLMFATIMARTALASVRNGGSDSTTKGISIPDSVSHTTHSQDTSEFIPWSQYRWADDQMYTITGEPPRRYTKIEPIPAYTYLGTYFGILAALHYYQEKTFWRASQSFRIRDNFDESLGANYGGHFDGGYF